MKQHCLTFGTNFKIYWYLFGSALCYIIRKFTFYSKTNNVQISISLSITLMSIGMMLSFFFELVSRRLQINRETTKKKRKNATEIQKITRLNYFLFVLSLAALDGIGMFFVYFNIGDGVDASANEVKLIGTEHIHVLIELVFVSVLGFFFLKKFIYKHHWFYSGVMFIGLAILLFANIDVQQTIKIDSQFYFGMICSLFHAIYYIIYKHYLDKKFVSPYLTIGIEGTIILFPSLVIGLITNTAFKITSNSDLSLSYEIINSLGFILTSMGYNIFIILLLRDFGPTHRTVTGIFTTVFQLIIMLIIDNQYTNVSVILMCIGDIILIIGVFGFNQIIIVYACNLHYDTEKEINLRALGDTHAGLVIMEAKDMKNKHDDDVSKQDEDEYDI